MKVSVNELTGTALDWAVAQCEGVRVRLLEFGLCYGVHGDINYQDQWVGYCPSSDWSIGGPIIEREIAAIDHGYGLRCNQWLSVKRNAYYGMPKHYADGPTLLIACMRCYVGSKLGHTIDIPEEMLK